MSRFFNQDNIFFRIMGVAFDLVELNILTLVACLPLVTVGASCAAMHSVLWHIVRNEETYVFREFVQAFKGNFKQSTQVWILVVVAAAIFSVDFWCARSLSGIIRRVTLIVMVFLGCIFVVIAQYVFIVLSRYRNTTLMQIKNAALLSFGFFLRSLGMLCILVISGFIYVRYFLYLVPLLVMFGLTLPQYCCAWLYSPIFQKIEANANIGAS